MNPTLAIVVLTFVLVTGALMALYAYLEERYRRFLVTKRIFGSEKEAQAFKKERMELEKFSQYRSRSGDYGQCWA